MNRILTLVLLVILTSQADAADNPFIGTWQLVGGEFIDANNNLVSYQSLGLTAQKVINRHHFSFITLAKGKFWAAGSGQYRFNDTDYTESPELASFEVEGNGAYPFNYKLADGYWYNSRFKNGERVEYEIWKRVN